MQSSKLILRMQKNILFFYLGCRIGEKEEEVPETKTCTAKFTMFPVKCNTKEPAGKLFIIELRVQGIIKIYKRLEAIFIPQVFAACNNRHKVIGSMPFVSQQLATFMVVRYIKILGFAFLLQASVDSEEIGVDDSNTNMKRNLDHFYNLI